MTKEVSIATSPTSTNASTCFVCCVEAGKLEKEVIRLVESLRRFGGEWAHSEVYAVQPRAGPAINLQTLVAFERLNVQFRQVRVHSQWSWYQFLNKPRCLRVAESESNAPQITWLDSDMLFARTPERLSLGDKDFAGCARDRNVGTRGPEDPNEHYWRDLCAVLDLKLDELPILHEHECGLPLRFYFNSGIFTYRRPVQFATEYELTIVKLLMAKIAHPEFGVHFTEQISLGLTAVKMGLRWAELPLAMNFPMGTPGRGRHNAAALEGATVLHYHDGMTSERFGELNERLRGTHPRLYDWLATLGPIDSDRGLIARLQMSLLHRSRAWRLRRHLKSCRTA